MILESGLSVEMVDGIGVVGKEGMKVGFEGDCDSVIVTVAIAGIGLEF